MNWLFKYASNHEPPSGFATEQALLKFVDSRTSHKLYNRFQVGFWSLTNPDEMIEETPTVQEAEVSIGVTIEPIFGRRVPGEAGPRNGQRVVGTPLSYQINDGTPDRNAVRAFNALVGDGLRWSHIGSRIEHRAAVAPAHGNQTQVYPTYEVYERDPAGTAFVKVQTIVQAPEPSMNFVINPYPPGPAPFIPSNAK